MIAFSMKWLAVLPGNAQVILAAARREGFDLLIGDETYDMVSALMSSPEKNSSPFVVIYDFVGHRAMTCSLKERVEGWAINRFWIDSIINKGGVIDRLIFLGVPEDIPDERFGLMQPNKRNLAKDRSTRSRPMWPADAIGYRTGLLMCSMTFCASACGVVREKRDSYSGHHQSTARRT